MSGEAKDRHRNKAFPRSGLSSFPAMCARSAAGEPRGRAGDPSTKRAGATNPSTSEPVVPLDVAPTWPERRAAGKPLVKMTATHRVEWRHKGLARSGVQRRATYQACHATTALPSTPIRRSIPAPPDGSSPQPGPVAPAPAPAARSAHKIASRRLTRIPAAPSSGHTRPVGAVRAWGSAPGDRHGRTRRRGWRWSRSACLVGGGAAVRVRQGSVQGSTSASAPRLKWAHAPRMDVLGSKPPCSPR